MKSTIMRNVLYQPMSLAVVCGYYIPKVDVDPDINIGSITVPTNSPFQEVHTYHETLVTRPEAIMLLNLSIILLSSSHNFAYYSQCYV